MNKERRFATKTKELASKVRGFHNCGFIGDQKINRGKVTNVYSFASFSGRRQTS